MAESDSDENREQESSPVEPTISEDMEIKPLEFEQLHEEVLEPGTTNVNRFDDVTLQISIELGRVTRSIRDILEWREGSVVETTKLSGMPMEILVNGRLFGKGEVVVVGDNLAIRITDLVKPELE